MSTNNGGPAFPMIRDMRHNADWDHEQGMTLRDYFAATAMQGMISHHGNLYPESGAVDAYKWADAMLMARGEEPT